MERQIFRVSGTDGLLELDELRAVDDMLRKANVTGLEILGHGRFSLPADQAKAVDDLRAAFAGFNQVVDLCDEEAA